MRNKQQKGFTLIELLVVIAIIGLLASVVLLALNSARSKSRDAKRVADIRQLQSGLELYFNDCGSYPITAAAGTVLGTAAQGLSSGTITNGVCAGTFGAVSGTTYITQTPSAPSPQDGTCATTSTNAISGNPYWYTSSSATNPASDYSLRFCVGAATGGLQPGGKNATSGGIQ